MQDVFKDRVKVVQTIAVMPTVLNKAGGRIDVYVVDPLVEQ